MRLTHYGLLVAGIAYLALAFTHTTAPIQALIALPGSAGLLMALWNLAKASIEHQYRIEEKKADNAFVLSATSHMAEVAFNKHVEFCEKYIARVHEGLGVLFREGPTPKALEIAHDLYQIRRGFILWETRDVCLILDRFEAALREIGANEYLMPQLPAGEKRSALVDKLYETFKKVTTLVPLPNEATPEIAASFIIGRLQEHLGISHLTDLRRHYLAEAAKRIA